MHKEIIKNSGQGAFGADATAGAAAHKIMDPWAEQRVDRPGLNIGVFRK